LDWRKSVFAKLEWLEMEKVSFDLTGTVWNGGSRFWACLEWPGMEEASFGLTGIAWNGGSWF
jgi:hypothetical protein